MAYLVQSLCPDGSFAELKQCTGAAAQQADRPMLWQRRDWPAPNGYQIEASFIGVSGAPEIIWSYAPFGSFVARNGDGGEVYDIGRDGSITIAQTQDGGRPGVLQHFVGPHCSGTGWLVAKANPSSGTWTSAVATLSVSQDPSACPPLDRAFTRWRLENISIPFIVSGKTRSITVPSLISEHYDGASIAGAQHMERTFFGKGWGRLVWEAWGLAPPTVDLVPRCPGTAWSTPPAPGWQLEDCRYSTNIVAAKTGMTGAKFGWPAR
jgi:hypothetical protein